MTTKRKYTCIAKVENAKFVKYRTNYPDKLINFLIKKFGACYYANFYFKTGELKGTSAGSWGSKKGFTFNYK